MPLIKKPERYAHPEGHTDVCYFTGEKGGLVTCGTDGDVRAWVNLLDDDPSASCISEQATVVISKKDKLYVGNDNNTVQILTHPDLEREGVVTRFASTVSALATTKNSNLIVSGACDMRIQVSNIITLENVELTGHEAPILGLSLDPREEFVASSSGDGSIRVWSIKSKKSVQTWNNIVPKSNSFFTAKIYACPSFHPIKGDYLAYPHVKEIVVVERNSWKEAFKLKAAETKNELSICKFSECGKLLAASSTYGEIIVWDVENNELVGYIEHRRNAKITSLVWNPSESNELAYCDALGQLACVEVHLAKEIEKSPLINDLNGEIVSNEHLVDNNIDFENDLTDDDNVISLSKIKASVLDDDQKSESDVSEKRSVTERVLPEVNLQKPFQPGSSPVHLLSRYMVWNDVGIVMCFTSEDHESSNIEVNFHDTMVHHAMHINNYLNHTMAALSTQALVLSGPSLEDAASKIVVVALQGWGSGNKEWSIELPDGEIAEAVAAGSNFVAVATSLRNLRLFMAGGTQREVIALPGPVVAMNGYENHLVVTYHSSIGAFGDQNLSLLWIRISGPSLKSYTLQVPLSPASNLMWLGFSDLGSPVIMDSEGIINIYDRKASLWRVASNTNKQNKGKFDHYFIIGVSETDRNIRCILCKGSHYPPTTPRPIVTEIPLTIPLCEPSTEKSQKEAKLWRLGSDPLKEQDTILELIVAACRNNVDFRVVELCEQIASQKVLELAMKYCGRVNRIALANKIETISEIKESDEVIQETETQQDIFEDNIETLQEEELLLTPNHKTPSVEIKPLTPSQTFGRRSNPFLKRGNVQTSKGLSGLNVVEEPQKAISSPVFNQPKPKKTKVPQKESFLSWYQKNKKKFEEEVSDVDSKQRMKIAYEKFKEEISPQITNKEPLVSNEEDENIKKRKLNINEFDENNKSKRSTSSKLLEFACDN